MVRLSFAGHDFDIVPQGALYWAARRALIVADLHLEKASWFARGGQMLPPYDSAATLADVQAVVAAVDPAEVWCLGDSFHDAAGPDRLSDDARAALRALTTAMRWTWITGNHDAGAALADRCGGEVRDMAVVDGLVLRHEAVRGDPCPELSGHFHPKLRVQRRGRSISRRCFVASATKLILPAFGALTGGLDAAHPEIVRAVGRQAEALLAVDGRLLRFALAA
ncbi:MAG: phosphoesterase [Sphingomonas sp.]|nr:phosphoesterase [Sphingomonas sp.]